MTDFGQNDFFVPSIKAVILSLNGAARIVDITHAVASYDVRAAGFILAGCCSFFPKGTIFLAVVDPGVGSDRKVLLARTDKYDFIAPDNGLLTLALEGAAGLELRSVSNPKYFLSRSSRTFEGRDRMAPAAAWLSLGTPASEFGPRLDSYNRLVVRPPRLVKGVVRGEVAYVDKFGNLITNIPVSFLKKVKPGAKRGLRLRVKGRTIGSFLESYSQGRPGQPFGLAGSLGTVEIAVREASAAKRLAAGPGDEVQIASG
jgi:S-adenosylmethionine hydrolase